MRRFERRKEALDFWEGSGYLTYMDRLLKTSAIGLAKMIREGSVTSVEVVKTYIEQAKKVNPSINAIVKDRYELAIMEAKDADLRIKAGIDHDLPLLGVPCTIKEMFSLAGMPLTVGLLSRRHIISQEDATAVARLRRAGAIPIGVTNVPVLALHFETNNKLYGQTNNPYNLAHIPGGSSGAEGAIISAAGSAFGLGSDIGGSIRVPAFFCGIFGHKPSSTLVPNTGQYPVDPDIRAKQFLCSGPLTRFSEDLMPILKIIAGPDDLDISVEKMDIGHVEKVKIANLKYYYVEHQNLHEDVKNAQDRAVQAVKKSGAVVQEIPLGRFKQAFDIFLASIATVIPDSDVRKVLREESEINLFSEFVKEIFGRSEFPFYILLNLLLGKFSGMFGKGNREKFFELGEIFRQEINDLLGTDGVLIYPTHPYPAVKHGKAIQHIQRFGFTGIFNILHCPSTAIPAGLNSEGLPVGIQAVSKKGNDHLTIATAKYLEAQGFKWIPPKLSDL